MQIADSISELRTKIASLRGADKRIAFVPTMGNLHAGHLRLVEEAKRRSDAVVVSIYVNPLQFGPKEDLAAYPRTLDDDRRMLESRGADLLFTPSDAEIYPRGLDAMTKVEVPGLSEILCGAFRPGHFRGVATVVNRLFNLVQPDVAVFGKKDYQQLLVIRLMVSDLGLPIEIVGVDTMRENDGLAMSSRNRYLSADERRAAPLVYRALMKAAETILESRNFPSKAAEQARSELQAAGFRVDYVEVRRQLDLTIPEANDHALVILAAAWIGKTRLIDNIELART